MKSGSISQIFIYPIKSFDGVNVRNVLVSKGGALYGDRRYSFIDEQGKVLSAKRFKKVHALRCSFDSELKKVVITLPNKKAQEFDLVVGNERLNQVISNFFECKLSLQENTDFGFPDDTEAFGPTLTTSASLVRLNQWFPEIKAEEFIHRFRVNLILEHDEAFFEDSLCGKKGSFPSFKLGQVHFKGSNVCQRCPVPTRHPETGMVKSDFVDIFKKLRAEQLHARSDLSQFNHFYRFCLNTLCFPAGKQSLTVGDLLSF